MYIHTMLLSLLACFVLACAAQQLLPGKGRVIVSGTVLCLWAAAVLYLTILSRAPVPETRIQLIPFLGQSSYSVRQTVYGMVENAVMFVPLGCFLPVMLPRLRLRRGLLIGAGTSLCIELLQLITHRGITATEDLLANTLGCVLGLTLMRLMRKLAAHA